MVKLNGMKAHEEISADDARQMLFYLDRGYNAFHKWVQATSKGS